MSEASHLGHVGNLPPNMMQPKTGLEPVQARGPATPSVASASLGFLILASDGIDYPCNAQARPSVSIGIFLTKTPGPSLPRVKRGREKIDIAARHEDVAMRPETKHSARNKADWHRLQSCINHPATKGGRGNKAGVASGT